jgi:hypothetical protein
VRFIWANILSIEEMGGKIVDFNILINRVGSEYDRHNYRYIESDKIPRLVKTHEKYDKSKFGKNKKVYIVRNPFDVMESYHEYKRHEKSSNVSKSISKFIRSNLGIKAWCKHVSDWLNSDAEVIRFEDMKKNTYLAFRETFKEKGLIDVKDRIMKRAVERSRFEKISRLEELHGRPNQEMFDEDFKFLRKGKVGKFDGFTKTDAKYIEQTIENFNLEYIYDIEKIRNENIA